MALGIPARCGRCGARSGELRSNFDLTLLQTPRVLCGIARRRAEVFEWKRCRAHSCACCGWPGEEERGEALGHAHKLGAADKVVVVIRSLFVLASKVANVPVTPGSVPFLLWRADGVPWDVRVSAGGGEGLVLNVQLKCIGLVVGFFFSPSPPWSPSLLYFI